MTAAPKVTFDAQAADFDRRAGLPAGAARRIAAAVMDLAPAGRGVLLDLGAGTGQIGEHLSRGSRGTGYVGLDLSGPMLAVFRRKLGGGSAGALVRANAATRWPVATGAAGLVFSSRAAHLLPPALLVRETLRVASPEGAVLVLGGVRTPPESLRAVVRREMRRLLSELGGVEPRRADASRRTLAEALAEHGGEVLPTVTAASWPVVHRAHDALAAWRAKSGLGGRPLAPEVQDEVLSRLEDWIRRRYGSLDVTGDATERYELVAIRLPKDSHHDMEECNEG